MPALAQLADPDECPVSFWRFAVPVIAGSAAAGGARYLARRALASAHPTTRATTATIAGIATFWMIGGLGWVLASPRRA